MNSGKAMAGKAARGRTSATEAVIIASGLYCAAGDQAFALLGAVGGGLTLCRPDEGPPVPMPGEKGHGGFLSCPAIDAPRRAGLRMGELLRRALARLFRELPAENLHEPLELHLLVPPAQAPARGALAAAEWERLLRGVPGFPGHARIQVTAAEEGSVPVLAEALETLGQTGGTLLLGAVDSWFDDHLLASLAMAGDLFTENRHAGRIPGEAAAFVALQPRGMADGGKALARLRALAVEAEPEAGRPDETVLCGLARAIERVAQHAGRQPSDIDCLVAGLALDPRRQVEWQQAENRLWPVRLDEARREAMQAGELDAPQPDTGPEREILDPAAVLGDTGVAETLLGLILAVERFSFAWPRQSAVVVTELGEQAARAALWVEPLAPQRQ